MSWPCSFFSLILRFRWPSCSFAATSSNALFPLCISSYTTRDGPGIGYLVMKCLCYIYLFYNLYALHTESPSKFLPNIPIISIYLLPTYLCTREIQQTQRSLSISSKQTTTRKFHGTLFSQQPIWSAN